MTIINLLPANEEDLLALDHKDVIGLHPNYPCKPLSFPRAPDFPTSLDTLLADGRRHLCLAAGLDSLASSVEARDEHL